MSRFEACEKGFTSNAKCLTEGIDLPAVDLVAFMSPKDSKVDIVQAAGRSMRLAGPDKTTGYILLPIHVNLELGESVNDAVQRSDFKTVFDVLRALMANDGEFDYLVRNTGDLEGVEVERNQFLGGRVEFVGGSSFMDARGIYESIEARLSDGITQGNGSFDERLEQLVEFKAVNGHCEVPRSYGPLGTWCGTQRQAAKKSDYPNDRRQRLLALGFRFSTTPDRSSENAIHAESPQDSDFPINEECEEGEASDSPAFK